MQQTTITCVIENDLATITLNAPPLNLVSLAMTAELDASLKALAANPEVRALVLQGTGDKAFCAGSDIGEFDSYMTPGAAVRDKLYSENVMYSRLARFPWPTIAAVHGVAYGGGLELALCCDLIVADPAARFALPEVRLGVFPGSGGTVRAARRIGLARATEMLFLGDPIDAATALDWKLVNRMSDADGVQALARELGQRLADGPASLKYAKQALALAFDHSEEDAIARMLPLIDAAFCTDDCREGVAAFREKRTPRFKGR